MSSAASVTMKEFEVPVPWGKMTGDSIFKYVYPLGLNLLDMQL
jgi:hypothetical protein